MQMTGYTKLFGSIVASTIWREPNTVRIVWITMLAMANKSGIVEASIPGLADLARVTIEECKEALQHLQAADEYSRTPDHEGRRIKPADGGWFILNHAKYRAKMGVDERREYLRVKQKEQREKKKSKVNTASTGVNNGSEESTVSTHADADAEPQSESDAESDPSPPQAPAAGGVKEGKDSTSIPTTDQSRRIATLFHRRLTTPWTRKEIDSYKRIGTLDAEDLAALEKYYADNWPPRRDVNILRHDLLTLLNNISGEIDRAKNHARHPRATTGTPHGAKDNRPASVRAVAEGRHYPGPTKIRITTVGEGEGTEE